MKRYLMTLVLSGFVGSLVLVGNAEACHKKKCACAPAPTCAVVEPAPCPPAGPGLRARRLRAQAKKCGLFSASRESSSATTRRPAPALPPSCARRSLTQLR